MRTVAAEVNVPIIASGGMGSAQDAVDVARQGHADAVAMADILHNKRATLAEVRQHLKSAGVEVRSYES